MSYQYTTLNNHNQNGTEPELRSKGLSIVASGEGGGVGIGSAKILQKIMARPLCH